MQCGRWTVFFIVCAIALCLTSLGPLTQVQAAGFNPVTGATFNNPTGTPEQQYAILNQLKRSINAAPRGSVIRMAFFSLSVQSFSDTLIAAHARGVNVQLIMDNHDIRPQWTSLQTALGADTKARSFAITCTNGCLSGHAGALMHAKLYLFSTSGSAKKVATVSSANPTYAQATSAFNNAYTVVGDTELYNSYYHYFNDMVSGSRGKLQPDYYRVIKSSIYTSYLFPRPGHDVSKDTIYSILSNVKCSNAAKGYGTTNGKTVIQVAMLEWTKARVDIAKKLWSLDDAGCRVEIITNVPTIDSEIMAALQKRGGRHSNPTVRDAVKGKYHVHHKYFTINGNYAGDTSSKLVFTGSHNFTNQGLRYNNDILLKIRSNSAYQSYDDNFSQLRAYAAAR